jgi:restriction system protein
MSLWVVRAGSYGEQVETDMAEGVAAIDWNDLGDLSRVKSKAELQALYVKTFPTQNKFQVANQVGQIWLFMDAIKEGDLIALPIKKEAAIAIGIVRGPYQYKEISPNVKHWRKVEWLKTLPRSAFDKDILFSMGTKMTVFRVQKIYAENRVRRLLNLPDVVPEDAPVPGSGGKAEPVETVEPNVDLEETAHDQLLKFIEQKFKGHEMANLVDAILRAQGYKTEVSPPGPDGGVDILAGNGILGFDNPRLCVQVKSSSSQADQKVFNELLGVMSKFKAQQGLFVSWGGYTKAVQQDSKKEYFSIRLWGQGDLVDAILANYEKLDDEIKAELPLKRIWVLVREEK